MQTKINPLLVAKYKDRLWHIVQDHVRTGNYMVAAKRESNVTLTVILRHTKRDRELQVELDLEPLPRIVTESDRKVHNIVYL